MAEIKQSLHSVCLCVQTAKCQNDNDVIALLATDSFKKLKNFTCLFPATVRISSLNFFFWKEGVAVVT